METGRERERERGRERENALEEGSLDKGNLNVFINQLGLSQFFPETIAQESKE